MALHGVLMPVSESTRQELEKPRSGGLAWIDGRFDPAKLSTTIPTFLGLSVMPFTTLGELANE